MKRTVFAVAASLCFPLACAQETPAPAPVDAPVVLDTVEVYASSPVGAARNDSQKAAANVQQLDQKQLEAPGIRTLSDALQKLGDVFRSDATGNPFQPDIFYRGYTISPLLGLPQGMSVYQDGVRVNELFGDVVNLDLIPLAAIRDVDLVPGSNPVFGRNTLGGALVMRTKTGFDSPGVGIEAAGGSYGRSDLTTEYGVAGDSLAFYCAVEDAREDGWRDHSHSSVDRVFARGTWLPDARTSVDLTVNSAENSLRGNGATPRQLLDEEGRSAVFTYPDQTWPRLLSVNLLASRALADGSRVSGNVYYRRSRTHSFNGDGTDFQACEDEESAGFLCEGDDDDASVVLDQNGNPVAETDDNDTATQNRSRTSQNGYGGSVEWERRFGMHDLTAGASADGGSIGFHSSSELGRLTDDRGTVGSGTFVADTFVHVDARNDSYGAYLMDVWSPVAPLQVTVAARWNRTRIGLEDRIEDGDLSGEHHFSHLNPMLGAAWEFTPGWTTFGSVSQSTRAPTPVELTCANPEDPCSLPNGFVDDPPLDQVVTRTLEWGVRERSTRWTGSLALFHAQSRHDILFITDGRFTNQGYFDNVGDTVRQGIELSLSSVLGAGFTGTVQVTGLVAEFRDSFLVTSPNHPLRDPDDGESPAAATQQVRSGDRIPLIPRVQYRVALDWAGGPVEAGMEVVGRGNSRYRGDESNTDSERLAGFALVNAHAGWKVRPWVTLFADVDNLLGRHYDTFGVYGEADDVLGDAFEDARRFVGPGAPRLAVGGVRLRF